MIVFGEDIAVINVTCGLRLKRTVFNHRMNLKFTPWCQLACQCMWLDGVKCAKIYEHNLNKIIMLFKV